MIQTIEAVNGGYRFMAGVSQYSCGIAAFPASASSAYASRMLFH